MFPRYFDDFRLKGLFMSRIIASSDFVVNNLKNIQVAGILVNISKNHGMDDVGRPSEIV